MNDGRMLGRDVTGRAESDAPDLASALLAAVQAAPRDQRVLAIVGPPSCGKTYAVEAFVQRCGDNAFTLALTEDDTSLFAFVFALVQSMGPIARGAQLSFNAMHARAGPVGDVARIASWLSAHVNADAWIAIDNVELLEDRRAVVSLLQAMIERCPRIRWLFAGRTLDPLPLETWIDQGVASPPFIMPARPAAALPRLVARLDETERELLAAVAPLRTLEPRLIGAIVGDAGSLIIRRIYDRAPALFEVNGSVRLHRDARSAMLETLRELGNDVFQSTVTRCGAALEAFEYYEELLQLYLRNGAHRQLEEVLARQGLILADHVNADTLDAALRVVSSESPGVCSLQAILASRRGQYDVAEALFESAARSASQPLAAQIHYAYGCDLLRRNRADCAPIFEQLLRENVPGAPHQSEIRSALAQAYVLCDAPVDALEQIKFALHVLGSGADDSVVKTRAAYVYFYAARDLVLAERIASDALAHAVAARAYTVAVGAASLLYNIACERDRPSEALAALDLLADCGMKLGNLAFQSYALIAMLEFHVEAGDLAKIARAIETLRAFDISLESLAASESLVAAEAMQRSWRGEFAAAYDLLEPTAAQAVGQDYRALREAQLAFFAAGANRLGVAREHATRALSCLETIDATTHKAARARMFLAIAMSTYGDRGESERQLELCNEPVALFPRLAAVREGALALHQMLQGEEDPAAWNAAFARMYERGAGGFAMMFREFPRRSPRLGVVSSVTIEPPRMHRPACS